MTRYPLEIFWSEEDKGFIAEAPDLPGCSAWGATEANAAREAQRAIDAWLEAARRAGREIPKGRKASDATFRLLAVVMVRPLRERKHRNVLVISEPHRV